MASVNTSPTDKKPRKKVYCEVCCTFVSSEHELAQHNKGRKHQKLLQIKLERQADAERSIYVRGFSKISALESDLRDYFNKFGNVSSVFVGKEKADYAIVSFDCPSTREKILSSISLPLFHEKHLIIKQRCIKDTSKKQDHLPRSDKKNTNGKYFLDDNIINDMKQAKRIEEQVEILISATCLTEADINLRKLIVEYLHEIFIEVFPESKIEVFGSSCTRIGLKGSDLDLTLLVDSLLFNNQVKELEEMNEESCTTNNNQLEFIVQFLKQFAAGFRNITSVPLTKCPLVKFVHRDSGISCDLSVNNRLAIRNTELIKCYLSADDRVRALAITIKNWGKAKHLTGSGGRQISNYCLVLMLIHYLQRTTPPVLPILQNNDAKSNQSMSDVTTTIDGWDCSFNAIKLINTNQQTLGYLLNGWFYYFGHTFNYVEEIIAIRHGGIGFNKNMNEMLHFADKPKFNLSPLSVQDPFELNHNLTQNLSVDFLERFTQSCVAACSLLSLDGMSVNISTANDSNFQELFSKPDSTTLKSKKRVYSFSIPLGSITSKLEDTKSETVKIEHICELITNILSQDLNITCERQSDELAPSASVGKTSACASDKTGSNTISCDHQHVDLCCDTEVTASLASDKRPREDTVEVMDIKRVKLCEENIETEFVLLCKVFHVTWQNRRRQRRLQSHHSTAGSNTCDTQNIESKAPVNFVNDQSVLHTEKMKVDGTKQVKHHSGESEVASPHYSGKDNHQVNTLDHLNIPLTEFKVKVRLIKAIATNENHTCLVTLCHMKGSLQDFGNLYAFFKKHVMSKLVQDE